MLKAIFSRKTVDKNTENGKDNKDGKDGKNPGVNAPTASAKAKLAENFGGYSNKTLLEELEKNKHGNDTRFQLHNQQVSQTALKAIEDLKSTTAGIKVAQSSSLFEEIATMYAEGELKPAVDMLRKHITAKRGGVEKQYWYMLMDIYQINDQKAEFEKAALLFATTFGCSPPSWEELKVGQQKNSVTGKNLIILQKLAKEDQAKMKDFVAAAKAEKFCRIDVSKIKFEDSDLEGIEQFLHHMYTLRKAKVLCVLLNEKHLLDFCKQYMETDEKKNAAQLNPVYLQNETIFWLLYLEIMQWKNKPEEFDEVAIDYAMNFGLSAPGWDDAGVMNTEARIQEEALKADLALDDQEIKMDRIITSNNVQPIFDYIEGQAQNSSSVVLLDLQSVDRFDFASASDFLSFMQSFQEKHTEKKVVLRHPNELVLCLFETIGLQEFLSIEPRIR